MTDATTGIETTNPQAVPAAAPVTQQAAPPATQQPAATPPAPAAPQVIGEAEAPATPVTEGYSYGETGDVGLDLALGFIGGLGFGADHPAVVAAVDGDFTKLEAHLDALGDKAKGWQRYIALAKDAYTRTSEAAKATQAAITSAVHEVAGGQETWDAVKVWAGKNADEAEKKAINGMLAAGPVEARAAALLLTQLYRNAGGTTVQPANATNPTASTGGASSDGTLSPREYADAVRELRGRIGGRDLDTHPEYQRLKARRLAWRG